ncbi:uncharacterized protein METZ01_LOCUS110738, partial [marine metagenome]
FGWAWRREVAGRWRSANSIRTTARHSSTLRCTRHWNCCDAGCRRSA